MITVIDRLGPFKPLLSRGIHAETGLISVYKPFPRSIDRVLPVYVGDDPDWLFRANAKRLKPRGRLFRYRRDRYAWVRSDVREAHRRKNRLGRCALKRWVQRWGYPPFRVLWCCGRREREVGSPRACRHFEEKSKSRYRLFPYRYRRFVLCWE